MQSGKTQTSKENAKEKLMLTQWTLSKSVEGVLSSSSSSSKLGFVLTGETETKNCSSIIMMGSFKISQSGAELITGNHLTMHAG